MKIEKAREEDRKQIAEIYVDGYYEHIKFFSKKKEVLSLAFQHAFQIENIYVAREEEVLGFLGCNQLYHSTFILHRKELCKHLGILKGRIAYQFLKKEFKKVIPIPFYRNIASIEFVTIKKEYRNQLVGTKLLKKVMEQTKYNHYVVEVASNNECALHVYEKLGFKEVKRVEAKKKQTGFDAYIYMLKDQV